MWLVPGGEERPEGRSLGREAARMPLLLLPPRDQKNSSRPAFSEITSENCSS
jgi:hypothetical protein